VLYVEGAFQEVHTEVLIMTDRETPSVLTLGESIVLAARLAALEHVRQEIQRQAQLDSIEQAVDQDVTMFANELKDRWRSFFSGASTGARKEAA